MILRNYRILIFRIRFFTESLTDTGDAKFLGMTIGDVECCAIEVPVPASTWLATRLQIAQQMYGAIREHGLLEAAAPELEAAS